MPSYSKAILIGNMTRDPDLKYLANQTAVCSFTLAVNHKYTKDNDKREEVAFIDCTAWGKSAETINQYAKKGDAFMVDGRIKQENWEDKQTGAKRSKLSIVVEGFQFLGGKKDDADAPPRQPAKRESVPVGAGPAAPFGDDEFKADDIPF